MTTFFRLSLCLCLSQSLAAQSALEEQIDTACLRHAISFNSELPKVLQQTISVEQTEQLQQLAINSCRSHFHQSFVNHPTAREVASEKDRAEMIENESTQEKVKRWLSEEPERNAGHKRLKKR